MRRPFDSAAGAFAITMSAAAGAQTGGPPAVAPPPSSYGAAAPAATADETVHMHDGWYLSAGLGGGYFTDDFEQTFVVVREAQGQATGSSGAFHIALGGTPARGLVLGGAVLVDQVADPKITVDGVDVSDQDDISVGTFVLVGPFVDWYFTAGEGLHLMGVLGGASIRVKDASGSQDENVNPGGAGASVGLGYNWWVGEQWSLGVLGRGTGATLFGENLSHRVTAGALMLFASHH